MTALLLAVKFALGADAVAVASLLLARFCKAPLYKIAGEEFYVRQRSLENQQVAPKPYYIPSGYPSGNAHQRRIAARKAEREEKFA
jgi:hypothetical protein